jgi:ABC-type antimicrobial peptide transport system permease subunit
LNQVYVPHPQNSWGLMNVVVRSSTSAPGSLESLLRAEVRAADADLAVSNVATLKTIARDSVARERYLTLLISMLAATALLLGAIGIYGVVSHAVSARQRELGLRAALGAAPGQLFTLVLTQSLRLIVAGLLLGLAGAYLASRALQQLLYETDVTDMLAYGGTIALVVAVAGFATFGPARRAGRIDPLITLKNQ